MLLNTTGEQRELTCFERDDKTQAYYSCSINWNNQFFIFGGRSEAKRQISRLTGHKLERVGSLKFDHIRGSCSVMAKKTIFLCFNSQTSNDYKRCRQSTGPLEQFSEVPLSKYYHRHTRTSCSDSKL